MLLRHQIKYCNREIWMFLEKDLLIRNLMQKQTAMYKLDPETLLLFSGTELSSIGLWSDKSKLKIVFGNKCSPEGRDQPAKGGALVHMTCVTCMCEGSINAATHKDIL